MVLTALSSNIGAFDYVHNYFILLSLLGCSFPYCFNLYTRYCLNIANLALFRLSLAFSLCLLGIVCIHS